MYRAVALWALRLQIAPDDMIRLEQLAREARIEFTGGGSGEPRTRLNGEDVTAAIREPEVTEMASRVAACPGVRRAMRDEQRRIGRGGNAVIEGRDIGTVVFPEARIKIFLDASQPERARRRAAELGSPVEQVAHDMAGRDQRDRTRAEAPLAQAPDADYIDSSGLTAEQVEEAILKLVRERTSN
jgi:cytidylate kinase